jgi:pSer/pThr/pTyr-binding forkhead associated (FHA) protein
MAFGPSIPDDDNGIVASNENNTETKSSWGGKSRDWALSCVSSGRLGNVVLTDYEEAGVGEVVRKWADALITSTSVLHRSVIPCETGMDVLPGHPGLQEFEPLDVLRALAVVLETFDKNCLKALVGHCPALLDSLLDTVVHTVAHSQEGDAKERNGEISTAMEKSTALSTLPLSTKVKRVNKSSPRHHRLALVDTLSRTVLTKRSDHQPQNLAGHRETVLGRFSLPGGASEDNRISRNHASASWVPAHEVTDETRRALAANATKQSAKHASSGFSSNGRLLLTDRGTTNGTFVNGSRVGNPKTGGSSSGVSTAAAPVVELRRGDVVWLGCGTKRSYGDGTPRQVRHWHTHLMTALSNDAQPFYKQSRLYVFLFRSRRGHGESMFAWWTRMTTKLLRTS